MKNTINATHLSRMGMWLNTVALLGVSATLLIAFYYQLVLFDLPCPLCLLQRVGLIIIGCGFLFNLCFGIKNAHYSMALFGCILTGLIAIRQVFLHIIPGDPGYGSTFLGLHFYTWSLIASVLLIVSIAIIMMLDNSTPTQHTTSPFLIKVIITLFLLLIAANLISTVLECGGGQCADNPTFYQLLKP